MIDQNLAFFQANKLIHQVNLHVKMRNESCFGNIKNKTNHVPTDYCIMKRKGVCKSGGYLYDA